MIGLYMSINLYNIQCNIIFFGEYRELRRCSLVNARPVQRVRLYPVHPLNYVILTFYLNYINALLKYFGTFIGIKHFF